MIFFITSLYLMITNIFIWFMSIILLLNNFNLIIEWNIFKINSMKMIYIIYLDWMTLMFMSTVMMISSMVIIYSMNYMMNDYSIKRFFYLIFIFILSMIFMIISPNIMSILLGWDGLGLSSYCLVAYYSNKKSFNSSMITILMNRIGDIMILMLIGLFIMYGSWNFMFNYKFNNIMMLIILITSFTKSAQIPFSSWLPLAMAAPTPISSLVHSSTLVTAGIYLLIRFNYLMNYKIMYMLSILSCTTMFMAGMSANMEFDLKKIIALSTLSQLSLMILTISMNFSKLTFFHLVTHAMFKSLLFLCSGIMIHNYFNHQDIRFMSFMNINMPNINLIFNIASLTLCGMPFLAGFYSKDFIIEMFMMNNFNWLMFILMFSSMGMTVSYTFRLMFYLTMTNIKINLMNLYYSYNLMNYSIIILLFKSLFYGSILNWILFSSLNMIYLNKLMKLLIYFFLLFGLIMGMMLPMMKFNMNSYLIYYFYNFNNNMWFLPFILKKNKINMLKFNNNLLMHNDNSWMELFINIIFYYFKMFFKIKYIYNLNFLLIMMFTMYMIMMIMYL
uniref:NADH-ubiquinone oxidoreductase chain 5 n=1 Tax=Asobara japonica TaxID=554476 RepID=A0A6B9XQX9_9HYME|nr:NADH dehydrogenase subunit 5 [Asobara japonica]QHR84922.1 NADH dehydrogenase subunit 5 [Asobara japonica]